MIALACNEGWYSAVCASSFVLIGLAFDGRSVALGCVGAQYMAWTR